MYYLEVESQESQCIAFSRYWKSDHLAKVQLCRYSLASNPVRNQLLVIARILSFLSTAAQIVCMTGSTSEVLQTVEKGTEYPFSYRALTLPKLTYKREESVFERIYFFTQLKYLVVYLGSSLIEPWINAPELAKVRIVDYS